VLECQINPSVGTTSTNSSRSTDNDGTRTSHRHKKTYSFNDIAPSIFEELQDDIANLHLENEQALNHPPDSANTQHPSPNQKRSEENSSPSPDTQEDDTDQS
jgi:hypothetical protein